jgi:Flp pilus assembly secretin CpaC
VLFDPAGRRNALNVENSKAQSSRESRSKSMIRRKKLACLGLAASISLPAGAAKFSQLYADPSEPNGARGPAAQPANADLLKTGIDQYNRGEYEDSIATLQEVDIKSLSQQDRQTLVSVLGKAGAAATERRSAREEFARGEEARKANNFADAQTHYSAVLDNPRADSETVQKAQQQLAVVLAAQKSDSSAGKTAYKQAVDEYRKGLWKQARADFERAQQLGFSGGFLDASPAEYLQKMDDGEQKYVAQHKADARAAYDNGRAAYRSGDFTEARKDFVAARDLGFQPSYLEGLTPSEYLERMDEKDSADKQASIAGAVSGSANATGQTINLASDDAPAATSSGSASDQQQLQHQAEVDRLAQQQKVYKAQGLVDLGKQAEKAGNDQEALSQYTQAVDLDPTNSDAVSGRDRLLAKMGRAPANGGATLTRTQQQISQIIAAINYKFGTALDQAQKDTTSNQFAAAENDVQNAQAARDEDPTVFNADDLRRMDARIQTARLDLSRAKAEYDRRQSQDRAANVANEQNLAEQEDLNRRHRNVAAYIKLSRAQIEQQNYAAALGVLDQILTIDPQNDYALGIRQFVEDKAIIQEQRHYREEFDSNLARSLTRADETEIPYEDIYRFPENWPDVSTLRDNELKNSNTSKEDQAVQALLDHRLPTVQLPQVPLADAIDFLRDITSANILVNWKALEADGIDKQSTQVTVTLHDVKFSKVLDIILQEAGGGKLAYTIDEGVITISTADELNKAVVTRVYDITDLLINPNFDPTIQTLGGGSAQVTGGSGGGSSSNSLQTNTQSNTTNREQQLMDIRRKIENTVEFSTWKDNDPNGYGQIDDFNNQLIITQTSDVHGKIANLLAQLREAQAVQVSIETRFLTVSRHFIDDVGVNVSLGFNNKNPNNWSPISITNATSSFTASPSTGLPGSLGLTPEPGGLIASATYGMLDDFTVGLLVSAVEASKRLSVVHAPRVTLQNGQGATMYQLTFIPYVGGLNTTVGSGSAIAAPIIAYATDGVLISIERALVTADHKYVTLDIDPQLDSFLGFTTFQFESVTPTTIPANTQIVTPGGFTPPSLSVQEATEQRTEVRTRVTVPDGGTLMLGGVTIAGQINEEAGVPGLSKIPFLKRLTTNASESNDEQVLLILVKPTILINKEIEAKNFPLLTSNSSR